MIITLLTDFGDRDTYVAQMKGVLLRHQPTATLIDLTHRVPPQDVTAGSLLLDSAIDAFAPDAVHLAVVDPGVGTARHAIAIRTAQGCFIGPDNGLFALVLQRHPATETVVLDPARIGPPEKSATFHGRDLFSPAAGMIAAGTPLTDLGHTVDPQTLHTQPPPPPEHLEGGLVARVLHIDHFGNLITNVDQDTLQRLRGDTDPTQVIVELGHHRIEGLHTTFADVAEGDLVAYLGSSHRLEIARRNAHAAGHTGASAGSLVYIRTTPA